MKVYKDSAYCFTCGWSGDIFAFVMKVENCDFKTAYESLGGDYPKYKNKREKSLIQANFSKAKSDREKQKNADIQVKKELSYVIKLLTAGIEEFEPMSDMWCFCHNKLPNLENTWEAKYINGEEINEIDVLRVCRQVRQEFNTFFGTV